MTSSLVGSEMCIRDRSPIMHRTAFDPQGAVESATDAPWLPPWDPLRCALCRPQQNAAQPCDPQGTVGGATDARGLLPWGRRRA
eukprot:8049593-Prorocentrum_lima.AAC.1